MDDAKPPVGPAWYGTEGHLQPTPQTSIPTLKSRFKDVDLPWEIPAAITDPE